MKNDTKAARIPTTTSTPEQAMQLVADLERLAADAGRVQAHAPVAAVSDERRSFGRIFHRKGEPLLVGALQGEQQLLRGVQRLGRPAES